MEFKTIDELFAAGDAARRKFIDYVSHLDAGDTELLPEGEKWSIAQIVEHVSIVDEGIIKICRRLLKRAEADGAASDGGIQFSDEFLQKSAGLAKAKIEAPEMVHPKGRPIHGSISALEANLEEIAGLRQLFDTVNGSVRKFPHPALGEISAQEWFAVGIHHQGRHLRQIIKLLARIKAQKSPGYEEGGITGAPIEKSPY